MGITIAQRHGKYVLRVYRDGRQVEHTVGTDLAEAEAKKREMEWEAKVRNGEKPRHRGTVGDALDRWLALEAASHSPKWRKVAADEIRLHIRPRFGEMRLDALTRDDVKLWASEQLQRVVVRKEGEPGRPTAASSVSRRVGLLAAALAGMEVEPNPARGHGQWIARHARNRPGAARHADAWTAQEVATLLALSRERQPDFYPMFAFYVYTGARRGEGIALRWQDVDFARGEIVIRASITLGEETAPKSRKARRVAMPPELAAILRRHHATRRVARLGPEVPVFATDSGSPRGERNVERSFAGLRAAAETRGVRPLNLHCTRHTYASLALAAGKPLPWVAAQLGHASIAVTMRFYAHFIPQETPDVSFLAFREGSG